MFTFAYGQGPYSQPDQKNIRFLTLVLVVLERKYCHVVM